MASRGRLAIVGASVRAAAQSALRAGFDVVGADLFADADLDGVCPITKIPSADYPDALADWLAGQDVDAWIYTGALENRPDLVDRMAEIAPLWGVSGEALRRCRNPMVLQGLCRDAAVPFPETRLIDAADWRSNAWLAKDYRHSNGVGVRKLCSDQDVDEARDRGAYAQRFVPGRTESIVFAVSTDRVVTLGATWQWTRRLQPSLPQVSYRGSSGPQKIGRRWRRLATRLGKLLRRDLGLRGLIGVDLVGWGDNRCVIEINPRFTASVEVLERIYGGNAIAAHSEAFGPSPTNPTWNRRAARPWQKEVLFAEREVSIPASFASWAAREAQAGRLTDRPRSGEIIRVGAPVCTLFESPCCASRPWRDIKHRVAEARARLYAE